MSFKVSWCIIKQELLIGSQGITLRRHNTDVVSMGTEFLDVCEYKALCFIHSLFHFRERFTQFGKWP
jgi:hypothetical protein